MAQERCALGRILLGMKKTMYAPHLRPYPRSRFSRRGGCAASGVNATPSLTAGSAAASPDVGGTHVQGVYRRTTPGFPSSAFAADITPVPNGTMWFTDGGAAPAIGRISAAGTIKEFRNGLMPYAKPFRIALGADGNMWFSDAGNLAIGRITPNGKLSEFSAPNPNQIGARGLAISKMERRGSSRAAATPC